MTDYVTYHAGETLEDTFRRSDGDETGYAIPWPLILQLESTKAAYESTVAAIKQHIEDHQVPEVALETEEPTGEEYPW
ncbi:hypothetical protein GCM10010172_80300 [Paractinoplanes ferrugineus]|uniref:Uncharacterized protein n=1 Tax=Paractinoplanes ferrugineus TaxID=113564 RepID=A0A919JBF4_9ACTN|nr:hypothetical protein [Actinoplanes ferrugineus]GIE16747.1 hypothetical protein Afe05nite_85870 [Actinoplanes ferrugineus]